MANILSSLEKSVPGNKDHPALLKRKPVLVAFHVSKRIDFCFFLTWCVNIRI